MVCLNKKGVTMTTIGLILILVSFIVLVILVTNVNKIESEWGNRQLCKLSILINKFNCKTFISELNSEQDVADKIIDTWSTFFEGKRDVIWKFSLMPIEQIDCFDYMRFKVTKEINIKDVEKILSESKYQKIIGNMGSIYSGTFLDTNGAFLNKLDLDKEYVITFIQRYNNFKGGRTSTILVTPSKDIIQISNCNYVWK